MIGFQRGIGCHGSGYGTRRFFDGVLADFRLYNRELGQADVDEIYAGNLNSLRNGLVVQLPMMDPGANPTMQDWSGNGHNGTNNGTDESPDGPPVFAM